MINMPKSAWFTHCATSPTTGSKRCDRGVHDECSPNDHQPKEAASQSGEETGNIKLRRIPHPSYCLLCRLSYARRSVDQAEEADDEAEHASVQVF